MAVITSGGVSIINDFTGYDLYAACAPTAAGPYYLATSGNGMRILASTDSSSLLVYATATNDAFDGCLVAPSGALLATTYFENTVYGWPSLPSAGVDPVVLYRAASGSSLFGLSIGGLSPSTGLATIVLGSRFGIWTCPILFSSPAGSTLSCSVTGAPNGAPVLGVTTSSASAQTAVITTESSIYVVNLLNPSDTWISGSTPAQGSYRGAAAAPMALPQTLSPSLSPSQSPLPSAHDGGPSSLLSPATIGGACGVFVVMLLILLFLFRHRILACCRCERNSSKLPIALALSPVVTVSPLDAAAGDKIDVAVASDNIHDRGVRVAAMQKPFPALFPVPESSELVQAQVSGSPIIVPHVCKSCGEQAIAGARFCAVCGASLNITASDTIAN